MNLESLTSVYFLGIGGIGMSALAKYFRRCGAEVSGYDRTRTALTDELSGEGIRIHFREDPRMIPSKPDLVIYTPAIPASNKELLFIKSRGFPMMKRSEVLGRIARKYYTIAVAGTHGKTTTTTLIAHILRTAGIPNIAFLGGISKNYSTNFLISPEIPELCVVEADEFDRSFLNLRPDLAIITSADPDHLDIYNTHEKLLESFGEFIRKIRKGGILIEKQGLKLKKQKAGRYQYFRYSAKSLSSRLIAEMDRKQEKVSINNSGHSCDFRVSGLAVRNGRYRFNLRCGKERWENLVPGLPGYFNLENTVAAASAAFLLKIPEAQVRKAIKSYQGVVRRFDVQIRRKDFLYIDDYAHHPEEIRACIMAVREICKRKKITGVFQPHLYSRTRDLAEAFAASLDLLDRVILLDIYPAREKPIPGVSSRMIFERMKVKDKKILRKDQLTAFLRKVKPEVLLTLGAGDIDQMVEPIKKAFGI